jgi:protein TonB
MTSADRGVAPPDRVLFTHLLASKPPRAGKAGAAATTASLIFHGAVIAIAVAATASAVKQATEEEKPEEVTFIKIEEQPPPPPPPPPEVKPPETKTEPKGFKTLEAPTVVPVEIPPPDTVATNEADFSGEGVEGGSAEGEAPAEEQTYLQGQVSVIPKMIKIVKPQYPEFLKKMEIEGTVVIQAVVKPDGKVDEPTIKVIKKLHPQLDDAAVNALKQSEFSPALYGSRPVRVIMQIPYTFKFK